MRSNNCITTGAVKAMLSVIFSWILIPLEVICSDNVPQTDTHVSAHETLRDLDMKIEVISKSKTIKLTITNHAPEVRYLRVPLDLTLFRINLSGEDGQTLKMTTKGVAELTEPAIGSVRLIELNTGEPRSTSIDLTQLFEFPKKGTIRCEISRLVHFTHPQKRPSEKEWMKFPPVVIVVDDTFSPWAKPAVSPAANIPPQ